MKKNILLPAVLLLLSACSKENNLVFDQVQAETMATPPNETFISITKAVDIATAFFATQTDSPVTKSNARIASTETIRDSKNNNEPMMYVMNYDGGGFTIVGASKNYYPILAYSQENSFVLKENMDEMGGIVVWLEETQETIRQSEAHDEKTKSEIRSLWKQYDQKINEIAPAINTKAPSPEQDAARDNRIAQLNHLGYACYSLASAYANGIITNKEYGDYLYLDNIMDNPGYALIAAGGNISSSQIGPFPTPNWDQGYPYNSQVPSGHYLGCTTIAIAQIMAYHKEPKTFDWNTMISQGGASIVTQNFLYNLAVDMMNGTNTFGTGANGGTPIGGSKAIDALKKSKYGYSSSMSFVQHNSSTVRTQLNASQPVWMQGTNPNTGGAHAWTCDGYKADTYREVYFIEFLMGSSGSYYYASKNPYDAVPSLQNPGINSMLPPYYFYRMNWGYGGSGNDWFLSENVNMFNGNYSQDRWNIINIKK